MIRGSCLCGGIEFEVDSVQLILNCHCSRCRKAQGAPFSTFAFVRRAELRFIKGEGLIVGFQSSPGFHRDFCRVCGSRAPHLADGSETWGVPAGLLDGDPGVRPALHISVGSKAPWWEIHDDLPKFSEGVPGVDERVDERVGESEPT
jgi:hypothetical protein